MSFARYLAYLTVLAAAAVLAVSVLPGATAGAATLLALVYTPRKDGQ